MDNLVKTDIDQFYFERGFAFVDHFKDQKERLEQIGKFLITFEIFHSIYKIMASHRIFDKDVENYVLNMSPGERDRLREDAKPLMRGIFEKEKKWKIIKAVIAMNKIVELKMNQ